MSNLYVFFRLACRCAESSKQHGFTYFGLQEYGRCFSASHAASSYNMHGSSKRCSNQHYQRCDDHAWGECVGKAKEVNYVYEIVEGIKKESTISSSNTEADIICVPRLYTLYRQFCATVLNIFSKEIILTTPFLKTHFEVHMKHLEVLVK